MSWFNYIGLIIVAVIMIPNIVFAVKCKDGFYSGYKNKVAEVLEQIGRYGCMIFMVFNIPYTWIGFYFQYADIMYIVINATLAVAYCICWIVLWKKQNIVRAVLLSVIPTLIFLFSGIMLGSIPLGIFAVIFAVCHILISVKNGLTLDQSPKIKRNLWITVVSVVLAFVVFIVGTFGSIIGYQTNRLNQLNDMSVEDMIKYDCSGKDKKISVAIIENGNITFHTYGANGEESTVYDYEIGSISKTFLGLLCAKAVSEGKLSLTDSISKYLDLDSDKYYPTIERLLTHTSGYRPYYFEASMIGNRLAHISNDFYGISKDKILDTVKKENLENKDYPFSYSNFGISVVGLVLEKIYNKNFSEVMNEFIRSDLKLSQTEVAKQSGNLDHYWNWKENDGYIPAGSMISNINDMAIYLQIFMNDKLAYSSNTFAKLREINISNPTNEKMNIHMDGIGMTWILDDKNGIVWHNGGTTDFNSYMGFTNDKKKGVVLLSNLSPNEKIAMTVIGAKILTEN